MARQPFRWGILGTANIARKNWRAIRLAGNSVVTAVASRDRARAQTFIDECQADVPVVPAPSACGTYEELLARPDVDAVYIPIPTGIRKEWVVRAAQVGKHVLCEKPCGNNLADVKAMVEACRSANVQFMDGVMFMHSQRLPLVRQVLDDGQSVGQLRRVTSQFSFAAGDDFLTQNIRMSGHLEPLGCLGDLGWYNIRFTLWALKEQVPERVAGRLLAQSGRPDSPAPVPVEFSGEMLFPGGVSAGFYCSFQTEHQQWASVSGTRGNLFVRDFVLPFVGRESEFAVNNSVFEQRGCDFAMEDHPRRFAAREGSHGTPDAQETNMIRTFADLVASGKPDLTWGANAVRTQAVMDACLRSAREGGGLVEVEG